MKPKRMIQSLNLLARNPHKRAVYAKKHDLFGAMGENCIWGPWLVPLYPKLIRMGNNVVVHKSAKLVTHDVINRFLKRAHPAKDFGPIERLGCIELGDNVYIGMNCILMPDVRIGNNVIIGAGSVVSSDIPDNSIAAGNPAQVVGRFDLYTALRMMNKSQAVSFTNQVLPDELAQEQWEKFEKKRAAKAKKEAHE